MDLCLGRLFSTCSVLFVHLLRGLSCEGVLAIEFPAPLPMRVQ
jgi:hypothetical protein